MIERTLVTTPHNYHQPISVLFSFILGVLDFASRGEQYIPLLIVNACLISSHFEFMFLLVLSSGMNSMILGLNVLRYSQYAKALLRRIIFLFNTFFDITSAHFRKIKDNYVQFCSKHDIS